MRKTYEQFVAELYERGIHAWVLQICHKRGVLLSEVFSNDRSRSVSLARVEVWEWMTGPDLCKSGAEVARIFGRNERVVTVVLRKHREAPPPGQVVARENPFNPMIQVVRKLP